MATSHRFQAGHLHSITRNLLVGAGTFHHIADDVAEILVKANLSGHDSHGVLRVPTYLKSIEGGGIVPAVEPKVTLETSTRSQIDGANGFGHYTARWAMKHAILKAKETGIYCTNLIRIGHIGRLGEYAEAAAIEGCIGLITLGSGGKEGGRITPFGGVGGVLSTNPIAIGVPTGDQVPFIIDMATSVIAEGKIQVARSMNADLPPGYIVDQQGNPSVKTSDFYDGGFLLPFGQHKGYAISLLTCLLGGLSGHFDVEKGRMGGTFMQVIDVNAFTPLETYQRGVRSFLDGIKSTPPALGCEEVLVPGDFEQSSRRQRLVDGIQLPDTIYQQICQCAEQLNVSMDRNDVAAADMDRYSL